MTTFRITTGALASALAGMIAWAAWVGNFWEAGSWLTTDPWGLVTLADLYFGFFLSAAVILAFERRWQALLWIVPIPLLGNVWTALWFIARFPAIVKNAGRK